MGRGARRWLGYGADLDQRPWERPSRQTLQMRQACGSTHVHQLKVHGSDGAAENFTCRQATAVSGLRGLFAHQEVGKV